MALESAGWGLAVAASLIAGAGLAVAIRLPERVAAVVTAFGGGTLLAAVALELVPAADEVAGPATTAGGLAAGTLVYVGADAWLGRRGPEERARRSGHAAAAGRTPGEAADADRAAAVRGESIAAGIFVDGVPESVALGLTVAGGGIGIALLVGVLVGNVVEAYGAVHPIVAAGYSKRFAVGLITAIACSLAAATVAGATVLSGAGGPLVGGAQAVAAGAVLAVVSISIVPYAFAEVSRVVALAVAAGFVAGYLLS